MDFFYSCGSTYFASECSDSFFCTGCIFRYFSFIPGMGFFRNSFSRRNFYAAVCTINIACITFLYAVCFYLITQFCILMSCCRNFFCFGFIANCTGVSLKFLFAYRLPLSLFFLYPMYELSLQFFHQKTALYYSPCSRYLLCSLLPHKSQLSHCVALCLHAFQ